jgi:YD repeat-containing protein
VQRFTSEGSYLSQDGTIGNENGQFNKPEGIATSSSGSISVADTGNNRIDTWTPEHRFVHDTKTIYYTPEKEASVTACQNHPEWANLPCQTEPAAQPDLTGSPELPVSTVTYNVWDETETTSEKFGTGAGATTRTKSQTYDSAGRALTGETTSTIDTALPKVTDEYNKETGALEKQSATIAGKIKTITSVDNTLGQLISYTDAEGNTTKYTYGIDGRVEEVNDPKGKQSYAYSPTTGLLEKLVDSSTATFTATYDVEGNMLSEGYPDGLTANYTYNPVGQATGIEYVKKSHCATSCPEVWYSDTYVPSIHGEILTQASTLSSESYAYDDAGRLTEALETQSGKGCIARLYTYDEESNRTSQTTRESETETCPTEGGTVEHHVYDSANHLIDPGISYETFGNTTKLPAADAGKYELTSEYYVDGQVANQKQNEQTIKYTYDPAGRTMQTVSEGKPTNSTVISHYAGPGNALDWTSEEGGAKWSRNIPGIDGALDAIQYSSGSTILQLHDLQGNIVETAGLSETETKVLSTIHNTEFGVPNKGEAPPKYAWLGAAGVATELATGISTEDGESYVPQVARYLQTASVVPPGAFPNGQGTGSVETTEIPGWSVALDQAESAATIAAYAAQQVMEREIAELAAKLTQERIAREATEDRSIEAKNAEEVEMKKAEELYYANEGESPMAVAAKKGPSFMDLVDEVASVGTAGGRWLYQHSIFNFDYQIANRWGKGWEWDLESEIFKSLVEPALECEDGAHDASEEVESGAPPGPITEFSVSAAAVIGCVNGMYEK